MCVGVTLGGIGGLSSTRPGMIGSEKEGPATGAAGLGGADGVGGTCVGGTCSGFTVVGGTTGLAAGMIGSVGTSGA